MKLTKQQALDKIEELKNYLEDIDSTGVPILSVEESNKFWGNKDSYGIDYSDEVLEECAKENSKGEMWSLVYIHGYSLQELKEKHKDFFYDQSWYEKEKFIRDIPANGYYLLNFKKNFSNMTWLDQEKALHDKNLGRATLAVVAEAAIALKKIKNENPLQNWWTWTSSRDSFGDLVTFGGTGSGGARLGRWSPGDANGDLGVVSVR